MRNGAWAQAGISALAIDVPLEVKGGVSIESEMRCQDVLAFQSERWRRDARLGVCTGWRYELANLPS
ncbi:MAG: hypothetical protein Rubg2KO_08650 [Rubricoccaceae bacterium]